MDITKDFRKYALSKGISSTMIDDFNKLQLSNAITTPYILEERQLNVATYDIFSRLLLDRIVFLSGEVSRESMDTIVAQLLYLDSVDKRDVSISIAQEEISTAVLNLSPSWITSRVPFLRLSWV